MHRVNNIPSVQQAGFRKQAAQYFNAEENKHGVRINPIQATVLVFLCRLMRVKTKKVILKNY